MTTTTQVSTLSPARAVAIIAMRELTDQLTSLRFVIVTALALALAPLAVYVGSRDYLTRLADYSRLTAERQEKAGGDKMAYGLALRAIRPPEPLGALVRGLDGGMPQYWDFTDGGVVEGPLASRPQRLLDILGQLDLEFLVRVVLGLLAILLAFDAVAGEKEMGTLRAVLSQPLSRPAFLAGKLTGGFVALVVAGAAAFLMAFISAGIFGIHLLDRENIVKGLVLAVTSIAYLLSLYAFGLLVSALSSTQKTSLVVLLVTWVVFVLAAPPLATLVAQAVAPVPHQQAIETRKQTLNRDLKRAMDTAMGSALLKLLGKPADSKELNTTFKEINDHKDEIDRLAAPKRRNYAAKRRQLLSDVDRDLERKSATQNHIARIIMSLSPAATFAGAATDLSGTGDARREQWLAAVNRHQAMLDPLLYDNPAQMGFATANSAMSTSWGKGKTLADIPAFSPPRRDAASALNDALPALALLILYAGIFITAGFIAFY